MPNLPTLYSFVRCPYAIRARFALKYVGIQCVLREVNLKNKPEALLRISPKGTVPVLLLPDGFVIDQSLSIIEWALEQCQDENKKVRSLANDENARSLIEYNDKIFVHVIHKYKYRTHYLEDDYEKNKQIMHEHLQKLNILLEKNTYLFSEKISIADLAVFPFIRQIFIVNPEDFHRLNLIHLSRWLNYFCSHPLFAVVMKKYSVWQPDDDPTIF